MSPWASVHLWAAVELHRRVTCFIPPPNIGQALSWVRTRSEIAQRPKATVMAPYIPLRSLASPSSPAPAAM